VSKKTEDDLRRLSPEVRSRIRVIYHSLNRNYSPAPPDQIAETLSSLGLVHDSRYILHLGGQWYKNRPAVVQIFAELVKSPVFSGAKLILAGKPWTPEFREFCRATGLQHSIVEAVNVSDHGLRSLYSGAIMFLFPSREEGFGWPILEAQACGCPVVTTDRPPMTEVAGDAAIFIDPARPDEAAALIIRDWPSSQRLRDAGFANLARFAEDKVVKAYSDLYEEISILHRTPLKSNDLHPTGAS
jgi:glycosyltransferase involved in cell wall biosynthesis